MTLAVDDARATLLRVLDELEQAERELDDAVERVDVVVVYSVGRPTPEDDGAWHEVGGWACTSGPKWAHAALLRRAADAFDSVARAVDEDDD
jgi:hypothetical protein